MTYFCLRGDAPCFDRLCDYLGGAECNGATIDTRYDPYTRKASVYSLHYGKPTDKPMSWSEIPVDIAKPCEEIVVEATEKKFEELWANPCNAEIFEKLINTDGYRESGAYW